MLRFDGDVFRFGTAMAKTLPKLPDASGAPAKERFG
jgi:hypothetical protein